MLAALGILAVVALAPSIALAPDPTADPTSAPAVIDPPRGAVAGIGASREGTLGASASAELSARFESALAAAHAGSGADGLSLAVVRDGRLLWTGAVGAAVDGVTLLPDTPMVIGSVTKTFVGALVMALVEDALVGLDDPVADHLPEVPGIEDITVRQLLDHTSGLADIFNAETRTGLETDPQRPWTHAEVLATRRDPWYEPGVGWAYANTNYLLLAMLAERLTGGALEDEITRRFLAPLGLASVRFLSPGDGPGGPLAPAWTTIFWGSGAMVANATDLARWGDALYRGELLRPATIDAMSAVNGHRHGLGLQQLTIGGREGIGHTGLLDEYTTLLFHLPDEGITIALLVNRPHADLGGILAGTDAAGTSLLSLALGS